MRLIGRNKKKSIGQTALEYALVIAVITVVVVVAAKGIFSNSDKGVGNKIFQTAVDNVNKQMGQ